MGRKPVVKGIFYPSSESEVVSFIKSSINSSRFMNAKIVIAPHAGYVYSGKTAVRSIFHLAKSKNTILLGPNHTGLGKQVSVYGSENWSTPLGDVEVNSGIVNKLCDENLFFKDNTAHLQEHSLEVMLPILKYFNRDTSIVPITIGNISSQKCKEIAEKLAELEEYEPAYIISSDMNHYENNDITVFKDELAISQILKLDPVGLLSTVVQNSISMCGVIPVVIAVYLANFLGLKESVLIEHTTSASASGDYRRVVGYAGILIK